MIADNAPGRTGTSSPPSDLAEVVCADPDLLALEFDALVEANFPDPADRPDPRPPRPTARLLARRLPRSRTSPPLRGEPPSRNDRQAGADGARARQRGPPAATPAASIRARVDSSAPEVMP